MVRGSRNIFLLLIAAIFTIAASSVTTSKGKEANGSQEGVIFPRGFGIAVNQVGYMDGSNMGILKRQRKGPGVQASGESLMSGIICLLWKWEKRWAFDFLHSLHLPKWIV